jgi:DNA (cytosine-5)-methyltransferase 1
MIKTTTFPKCALSLFSSAGIGELGVKACGINILLSNELLKERCSLYHENYPDTENICGDIWKLQDKIVEEWVKKNVGQPYLVYATPPCQGMSFNSVGRLQFEIRAGKRPKEDPRNRLIIPTINIIKKIKPKWILLENVPDMQLTIIRTENNEYKNIIEYIKEELGLDYVGKAEVVNCADYGIPQTRTRLITIFTNSEMGKQYYSKHQSFLPTKTHSKDGGNGLKKWVSLKDAIGNLPQLSAENGKNSCSAIPWHIVPIMKKEKFWWVKNTPYNETAYNNQCTECGYQNTPRHGMCMKDGIHQSKKDTPIYCAKCGALLPRPSMIDRKTGIRRRIKGFDSAYRRMVWEMPSPTLTQNFQYEASDKKLHPDQNRTLSVYEALKLQTIAEYKYKLSVNNKPITRNLCCQIIGESVPPRLIELICSNILAIDKGDIQ